MDDLSTFISAFYNFRDGQMTEKESFTFRHGGTFLGTAFRVCFTHPVVELLPQDIAQFLIEAAKDPLSTDLQLYLKDAGTESSLKEDYKDPLDVFIEASGFEPMSLAMRPLKNNIVSLRLSLFSAKDLPGFPSGLFLNASQSN